MKTMPMNTVQAARADRVWRPDARTQRPARHRAMRSARLVSAPLANMRDERGLLHRKSVISTEFGYCDAE
ncbi:hypothetical protein ACWEQA_19155 [Nocardia sp. NPDC004085]